MSCECQNCNNQYKVDILVDDEIWKKILSKKGYAGLLCGKCIIDKLESFGYDRFKLVVI